MHGIFTCLVQVEFVCLQWQWDGTFKVLRFVSLGILITFPCSSISLPCASRRRTGAWLVFVAHSHLVASAQETCLWQDQNQGPGEIPSWQQVPGLVLQPHLLMGPVYHQSNPFALTTRHELPLALLWHSCDQHSLLVPLLTTSIKEVFRTSWGKTCLSLG